LQLTAFADPPIDVSTEPSTELSTDHSHDPFPDRSCPNNPSDLPRDRLRSLGAEALSDAELVALLLRTGSAQRDAVATARLVLEQSQGLLGLARFCRFSPQGVPGLGPAKYASLSAAIELGRRLQGRRLRAGERIRGPAEIHLHFHPRLRDCERERFLAILLDSRHRVLREITISQGTLTASLVHPREVFRAAVRESAAALVLVHNHPSGDPAPSGEDREVTRRLCEAGRIVGIRILDHVVVAERGYFSFCEAGEMDDTLGG
jgi:DNA repair protein RadC